MGSRSHTDRFTFEGDYVGIFPHAIEHYSQWPWRRYFPAWCPPMFQLSIGINAAGNIWSAGDEMSYIPPKFDEIVIKLPAEPMRMVQLWFAVQARHRGSQRESVIVLVLHELWRHPLCTFRLCLHVGINARWASVTYFLLGHLVPANIRQPLTPLQLSSHRSSQVSH